MRGMRANIRLFYVYIFFNRLEMWLPMIVLFLQDRGFSLTQYTIVDAVWYLSTLIFEVPTGAITDRCGKKISLIVAALTQSLALWLLVLGTSFLAVLVAYVLWGLGSSFETGTHDALVYDSLKQAHQEQDYRWVMGRIRTLTILAGALGSVVAGYLGGIDLALPVALTAAIALLTVPLVLFLAEPPAPDDREPSYSYHIKESFHYVRHHRLVALLILYSAILATAVWGLYVFYQPLLDSFGIPIERIGLLYLVFRLSAVAGASFSDPLHRAIGRAAVYLIPLCFMAAVFGLTFLAVPGAIVCILAIYFIEGLYYPITSALLNRRLPSGKRATVISLGSVLACLMGAVAYPLLGRIADLLSLQAAFLALGLGMLVCVSLVLVALRMETVGVVDALGA